MEVAHAEQQAEIEKFRKVEAQKKRELKDVRKQARAEMDWAENWRKWANIFGMPAFVAVFGVALAVYKNKRASAK